MAFAALAVTICLESSFPGWRGATRPNQLHNLAAQVSGQLNSAGDGRLFIQYSNGTIHNVWQNEDVFNGSQNITGNFTTPANVSSFQVGTEVVLDNGNLAFDDLTLTAYSDRIIAVPLTDYRLTAQITGELNVDQGQGGKVWAVYENLAGQPLGRALLWPNPANFSGTAVGQAVFTPVPLTDKIRIALETNLDAGYLAFDNLELENLPTTGPIGTRLPHLNPTGASISGGVYVKQRGFSCSDKQPLWSPDRALNP